MKCIAGPIHERLRPHRQRAQWPRMESNSAEPKGGRVKTTECGEYNVIIIVIGGRKLRGFKTTAGSSAGSFAAMNGEKRVVQGSPSTTTFASYISGKSPIYKRILRPSPALPLVTPSLTSLDGNTMWSSCKPGRCTRRRATSFGDASMTSCLVSDTHRLIPPALGGRSCR